MFAGTPSSAVLSAMMLVLLTTLSACMERPMSLEEWEREWTATVERVESAHLEEAGARDCEEALAHLRDRRPELTPAPLDDLQRPVDSWFTLAEGIFFECEFPEVDLESMDALEAEVEAVLDLER